MYRGDVPYGYYYVPPENPTRETLSDSLLRAVKTRNIEDARAVFATAFWDKIKLVPGWYPLLAAALGQDRPMTKLLITHGARWNAEETRCLHELFRDQWPQLVETLRLSGLRNIDQEALSSSADPRTLLVMAERLLIEQGPHLEEIKKKIDQTQDLKVHFNKKAANSRFERLSGKDLIKPGNFDAIVEASQKEYYRVTAIQFYDIVQALYKEHKSGAIPDSVVAALRTLKESGTDCSLVTDTAQPPFYHGKKEPGLTKVLVDLDILKPDLSMLCEILMRAGLPLDIDQIYWRDKYDKNAEFFFQTILEVKDPKKFIPQRGKVSSYEILFKEAFKDQVKPRPQPPKKKSMGGIWPFS